MKRGRISLFGILLLLPFIILLESGCGDQGRISPTSTFEEAPDYYEGMDKEKASGESLEDITGKELKVERKIIYSGSI